MTNQESLVERRIREAMERGEFDDLQGSGEPIELLGDTYDELWWLRRWVERERLRDQPESSSEST